MSNLKSNEIQLKFHPRKIELEPKDLLKISHLIDGEIVEDPSGRHKPGAPIVINHGDIGSVKFSKIMFPAPNPIEFYLFSTLKSLENIRKLEPVVQKDHSQVNLLLLEELHFCIFAVSAIEAFLNQIIPVDFKYKCKDKYTSKIDIEKDWSIEDKFKKAIPQLTGISIPEDVKKWSILTSLIKLRNDLIHLKTLTQISDFKSYQDLYKRLLDYNYEESFVVVKEVISAVGTAQKII